MAPAPEVARIAATSAIIDSQIPRRLTAYTWSKSSTVVRSIGPGGARAAPLSKATSSRPKDSTVRSTAAWTLVPSARSQTTYSAVPPQARMSSVTGRMSCHRHSAHDAALSSDLPHRLPTAAAIVVSASLEVLAWNAPAIALMEDFSPLLRATAARYPGDSEVAALVDELRSNSAEFESLWATHDVTAQAMMCKTFQHPAADAVSVNCDTLDIADRDQQMVIYTADPGSPAADALCLLSVLGTQRMTTPG
ncbi:hypothetical protein BH11ACT6_BH11ACT6_36520 [soil metagenome]